MSLANHAEHLSQRHRKLDELVEKGNRSLGFDPLQLCQLKRKRLRTKEQLEQVREKLQQAQSGSAS